MAAVGGTEPAEWQFALVVGLLIYVSTLFFASNAVLLAVLLLVGARVLNDASVLPRAYVLPVLFSLLAFANLTIHSDNFDPAESTSSIAVVLVPLCAILAPRLPRRALEIFVVLVCAEVLVGVYEFSRGQIALQWSGQSVGGFREADLLYDLRVYGLSANSSILAEKIFLALLLVMAGVVDRRWWLLVLPILGVGLLISFNRTAILASAVMCLLYLWGWARRTPLNFTLFLMAIGVISAALWINMEVIVYQLLRGSVDLSHSELSRLYFWETGLSRLVDLPFSGNGSLTWRVPDPITGVPQHAHNSVVMILVTHGLPIGLLMLLFVGLRINKANWKAVAAIGVFSMTQYLVFWNLSVPDMVFYWFLGLDVHKGSA